MCRHVDVFVLVQPAGPHSERRRTREKKWKQYELTRLCPTRADWLRRCKETDRQDRHKRKDAISVPGIDSISVNYLSLKRDST